MPGSPWKSLGQRAHDLLEARGQLKSTHRPAMRLLKISASTKALAAELKWPARCRDFAASSAPKCSGGLHAGDVVPPCLRHNTRHAEARKGLRLDSRLPASSETARLLVELLLARELSAAPAEILAMQAFTVGRKVRQTIVVKADRGATRA